MFATLGCGVDEFEVAAPDGGSTSDASVPFDGGLSGGRTPLIDYRFEGAVASPLPSQGRLRCRSK